MLGLIQQLWAVKGSDPPPSPALEQGLSTLLREHASFFMSFFFLVRSFSGFGSPASSQQRHTQANRDGRREKQEHAAKGSRQEPWS